MHNHPWMTEDHRAFGETVRRFIADDYQPNARQWQNDHDVPKDFWRKSGELGILGASIPEAYGGLGLNRLFDGVTFLELARSGSCHWGFGVHNIVTHYLIAYGTEGQKAHWLPKLATGEMTAAIAMSEPGTGSDLQAIQTTAILDGNTYRLNGSKTFITNGKSADLIVVVAKTDPKADGKGVSLIVVETQGLEGFSVGRVLDKIGQDAGGTAELSFQNVEVPTSHLLGHEEGQGFYQLMHQLSWELLLVGLTALGQSQAALRVTLNYVKERKAFGQRVMDFQNTRFKLAEAATKIELMAALIDQSIQEMIEGTLTSEKAAMVKWWSSQAQCDIVDECLQLHGGYGYINEFEIAGLYRDARVQKIYGGTNEIMKELIARGLDRD